MSADQNAGYNALQARVNNNTDVLLKRFETIMQLAPVESKDKNIAAAEAFQIETHASSIVRAAEDLAALTRSLKEAWLFGHLGDGFGGGGTTTDEDARIVGEMLRAMGTKVVEGSSGVGDGGAGAGAGTGAGSAGVGSAGNAAGGGRRNDLDKNG